VPRPLVATKVTAAILERNGLFFAARRKPGKHLAGYWEFPGGKIEPNESPQQCLAREMKEEFGVQVEVGAYLGESIYDYGHKVIQLKAYRVTWLKGIFKLRDHDEVTWLEADELHSLKWAPADVPLLNFIG
jgi:mutator protein MutT